MKTIQVTVSPQGETRIETKGFSGQECRTASRALEAALGNQTAEHLTSEFYQTASSEQRHVQRNG